MCSCSLFFSRPLFFTAVAASFSHFLTVITKCSCFSFNKKCLLCFLSLALALCRSFSRWASLACPLLSLFLCVSLSLYSKFVEMTINLRVLSICHNWPARTFPSNREFYFQSRLSSQISQMLNSMHEGNRFYQKLLEKAYFMTKMTGATMVRLASSDFWKAP